MEQISGQQYMYMNGDFHVRFVLPNIPPSSWIRVTDVALLKVMKEDGEREITKLKNELVRDLTVPHPDMCKIITTYRENYKDIVDYYSPSNYEQYKRDIASTMYFRDNCIVADPLHMM